jgi:hypothetical protein
VHPVCGAIAHPAHLSVLFDEMLNVGTHHQLEIGVFCSFGREEFQESRLRYQQNVGESRFQPPKVNWTEVGVR